jgi:hypothetical protein
MDKQLFDDAIGEVPPSTVDVDAAIARGRRADRLRRLASPTVATVAAVAVLLGGVAVVMLSDDEAGGYAPAAPPSTTKASPTSSAPVSESPCTGVAPTAPPQPEKPAVAEDRLTGVLTQVVSHELGRGATLEKNPISKDQDGKPLGPLEAAHWYSVAKEIPNGCSGGEDYYMAEASVKSASGTGSVMVLVARAGGMGGGEDVIQCDDADVVVSDRTSCDTETTPNGDLVLLTGMGATQGSVANRVDVLRADQTFVVVESSNMATSGKYPGPPNASKIPLTHEQLKAIALDPDVTLYPH